MTHYVDLCIQALVAVACVTAVFCVVLALGNALPRREIR